MGWELYGELLRVEEGESYRDGGATGDESSTSVGGGEHEVEKVGCVEEFVCHCAFPLYHRARGSTVGVVDMRVVQVGVPYIKRRLDHAYEVYAGGAAANLLGANYRRDELDENVYYSRLTGASTAGN